MKMHKRYFIILSLMPFLLLAGCAHLSGKSKSEGALRDRVNQEWGAKVKGDWGAVYDLTSREFKNKTDRNRFIRRSNLRIENYSIKEVRIDSEQGKAWAQVSYDINHMGMSFTGANSKEEWIWEDGEWRLNLKFKRTPFD